MNGLVGALVVAWASGTTPALSPEGRLLFETAPRRLDARVGEWVTYQLDGGPRQGFLRLAVVGEQKDALGRDAVWMELELGEHWELKAPLAQFLLLVSRDLGLRRESVTRLFVAHGVTKPQEVDHASLPAFLGPAAAEDPPTPPPPSSPLPAGPQSTLVRGKPTRLMTLAGTVMAEPLEVRHRQLVLKRYWMSHDVPLLHLAKIELPAIKYSMEARDYGVDARPRVVLPSPRDPKLSVESGGAPPPALASDPSSDKDSRP
jgi:hypothetical protein